MRSAIVALVVSAGLLLGVSPAGAGRGWMLEDYEQSACFSQNVHDAYYGVYLRGRWTSPVDAGAHQLPSGTLYDPQLRRIPPGSSRGEYSLAYVHVTMYQVPAVGRYTAVLWANDGHRTGRVPIVLDVRDSCY